MAGRFESGEAIRSHQLKCLGQLLQPVLTTNRFYRRKFGADNLNALDSLEAFFQRAPFTTKQELVDDQLSAPPFGTNLTFPIAQYSRFHQTSGTTSAPLRWLDTPESWEWMLGNWRQIMVASGVKPGDRLFFAFSFGPFIGFWLAFETAVRMGALCLPGGGMSSAARARAIVDNEVTVLCCTPTYALHLAEVSAKERLPRGNVKRILVAGEPGGSVPSTRARIEQAWHGAEVFDHHGMTEVGPVTYQCPEHPGVLHVLDGSYIAEVIHQESGKHVAPGGTGELVLTNLGRTGSPLLRYRTGDLVKAITCRCGRSETALEGGILGRVDDMTIVRGVNVYPSAVEQIIRNVPGIAEYQVRISTGPALSQVMVTVEPSPECVDANSLAKRLENAFQSALALRVDVAVASAGSLPRYEMKARRWTKE